MRPQSLQQEKRAEMKMASRKNKIKIEIRVLEFEHRAGISQNKSMFRLREDNGKSGRSPAGSNRHTSHINTRTRERIERNLPKRISADFRNHCHARAKHREVVRKNRGRCSQRDAKSINQSFLFRLQCVRHAIKN